MSYSFDEHNLRAEIERLKSKLAAAESACREALGDEKALALGLFEMGKEVGAAISGKDESMEAQARAIEARLRAVLAGEGEASNAD